MFLVPVFVKIFADLGGDLPTLTQYVVNVSNFLRGNYYIIFPVLDRGLLRDPQVQEDRAGPPGLGPDQARASR